MTLLGQPNGGREELFDASYRTRDALVRLAAEHGVPAEIVYTVPGQEKTPLDRLERCFFDGEEVWEGDAPCIRLLEDVRLREKLGRRARERSALFSSEQMAERYLQQYQS